MYIVYDVRARGVTRRVREDDPRFELLIEDIIKRKMQKRKQEPPRQPELSRDPPPRSEEEAREDDPAVGDVAVDVERDLSEEEAGGDASEEPPCSQPRLPHARPTANMHSPSVPYSSRPARSPPPSLLSQGPLPVIARSPLLLAESKDASVPLLDDSPFALPDMPSQSIPFSGSSLDGPSPDPSASLASQPPPGSPLKRRRTGPLLVPSPSFSEEHTPPSPVPSQPASKRPRADPGSSS